MSYPYRDRPQLQWLEDLWTACLEHAVQLLSAVFLAFRRKPRPPEPAEPPAVPSVRVVLDAQRRYHAIGDTNPSREILDAYPTSEHERTALPGTPTAPRSRDIAWPRPPTRHE